MADTKITALAELAEVPAANDLLVLVDVSDTTMDAAGTDKKITTANLLKYQYVAEGGTPVAQRQTLDFVEGFEAADDSFDEKTTLRPIGMSVTPTSSYFQIDRSVVPHGALIVEQVGVYPDNQLGIKLPSTNPEAGYEVEVCVLTSETWASISLYDMHDSFVISVPQGGMQPIVSAWMSLRYMGLNVWRAIFYDYSANGGDGASSVMNFLFVANTPA